jgi:hypothetical protein
MQIQKARQHAKGRQYTDLKAVGNPSLQIKCNSSWTVNNLKGRQKGEERKGKRNPKSSNIHQSQNDSDVGY